MRNKPLVLVLTAAVIFGLLAAFSVKRYLSGAAARTSVNTIVVARVEIPLGARITPEQLTTVEVPRSTTPDDTFDAPDKVTGRIALSRIAPREPVTGGRLASEGAMAGLAAIIPEGYRAMTVKIDDETGLAGFIMPGTTVDVLAVINPPGNTNQDPISKIVLQNIKVLANGQNLDQPKDEREAKSVRNVTLQVTPEQAEKLALSSYDGKLQLAMRNATDQNDQPTVGVTKRTLLTGERAMPVPEPGAARDGLAKKTAPARRAIPRVNVASAQAPATPAPTPEPRISVEIFDGLKKRSVEFPPQP